MGARKNKAAGADADRIAKGTCYRSFRDDGVGSLGAGSLRARGAVGTVALGLLLGALGGCQGPTGLSPFHYGGGADCTADIGPKPVSLQVSLDPLRDEFDRFSDVPRVVALMPHMGCERGAEILRQQVLDAYPNSDLRLLVIWQDIARSDDAAAAAGRATLSLVDARVTAFHDCSGLAGRAFARGNLPVAEAREVFLFYPAGTIWPRAVASEDRRQPQMARTGMDPIPDVHSPVGPAAKPRTGTGFSSSFDVLGNPRTQGTAGVDRPQGRVAGARKTSGITDLTPRTDSWVHQLGRVAPEKFCTPQELPGEMRMAVRRLLVQAEARRQRLAQR